MESELPMNIEKANINDLISPDWNPRQITETEMEKLKTSIKEFGYVDPIIVNSYNNHIVGGNQRYLALKELGYNEVEVLYINEPDILKEKAMNIALNKISGEWNQDKLDVVLEEIQLSDIDITLTGFDEIEFTNLSEDEDYIIPDDEPEYDESIADDIETIICPSCGYEIPKH